MTIEQYSSTVYASQLRGVAIELRKLHADSPGLDWGAAVAEDLDRLAVALEGFTPEMLEAAQYLTGYEGIANGDPDDPRVYVCTWMPERLYAQIQLIADRIEELL